MSETHTERQHSSTDYYRNARLPWTLEPPAERGGNSTVTFTTQDGLYSAEVYLKRGVVFAHVQRCTNRRIPDKEVFTGPLSRYHADAHTTGHLQARIRALAEQGTPPQIAALIHLATMRHSVWCIEGCAYAEHIPDDDQEKADKARNRAWSKH